MKQIASFFVTLMLGLLAASVFLLQGCGQAPSLPSNLSREISDSLTQPGRVALSMTRSGNSLVSDNFIAAVREGNLQRIATFMSMGFGKADRDSSGRDAFSAAIEANQPEVVSFLISKGFDPNQANADGLPLLHRVINQGKYEIANALLKAGVDPNQPDANGYTLLERAVMKKDAPLAKMLLAAGCDPNSKAHDGQAMILSAAIANDTETVRWLLEHGASPNVIVERPISDEFASRTSDKTLVNYLQRDTGYTPLMLAAKHGNFEMVKLLIDKGAKRNAWTKRDKKTARWLAQGPKQKDIIRALFGVSESDLKYRVVIDLSDQKARTYRVSDNSLVQENTVSTGKAGYRTPTGEYMVTDKHRVKISTIYGSPMPFFMRLNNTAIGMHQGVCPGYPASHGCVRMPRSDVAALYKILPVGTPVIIQK